MTKDGMKVLDSDMHLMEPFDHHALASLNSLHVDAQRVHFEAEFGAAPRE